MLWLKRPTCQCSATDAGAAPPAEPVLVVVEPAHPAPAGRHRTHACQTPVAWARASVWRSSSAMSALVVTRYGNQRTVRPPSSLPSEAICSASSMISPSGPRT